jgi:Zn-dependent metalloprotease
MALARRSLPFLTLALCAAPAFAQIPTLAPEAVASLRLQEPSRVQAAVDHLHGLRSSLGLDGLHTFTVRNAHTDATGETHAHFQQHYHGVPVFGGAVITHTSAQGEQRPITDSLVRNVAINVTPNLTVSEALATAHGHLRPTGGYASAPSATLVIFPVKAQAAKAGLARQSNAEDFEDQLVKYVLAYHVHTSLRNEGETKDTDYLIDAHTGAILKTWDDLHTTAATGSGVSQFSGTVSLNTNLNGSTYELKDTVRSMNITTYNLNHATSGTGTLYTDADNAWGNGANYTGSTTSTTSATGQTAAVDAHYGIGITFDFYKNLFNRNGIDGNGKATYSRVHYSTSYDNAFWDDSCFCMTYGDGSSFKSLEAPDVAGHEMSHGVCANTANLTYSGEPGGLNEANSDMFGNMVELYARNGFSMPATVANTDACWTVGEQLASTPLRYMYKPSLDGSSPNAWSSSTGGLDVHYSSGPANRMFFFLSQGASSSSTSNYYSSYAPSGFTGIGPEKAIRIWYKALTTYMTASTNYAAARTASLNAATALYGSTGAEYAAVQNAFGAINVGALAPAGVTVGISPATATVVAGGTAQFTATVSGSSNTSVTWTCTAGTISTAGLYTAPATAGTYTVKATSAADTTKSASATVTVTAAGTVAVTITPTTATVSTGATKQFTATVTGNSNTAVTWTATGGTVSSSGLYTAPASAGTYTVKATSVADTSKSASATVTVTSGSTSQLVLNPSFESGATSWSGSTGTIAANGTSQPAHTGTFNAWLCGYGSTHTEYLYQSVAIPSTITSATLTYYLHIDSAETSTSTAYDTFKVQVRNSAGTVLATLSTVSNLNKATGYKLYTFDLSAYKGQTVRLDFTGTEDSTLQTSFVLDDVNLNVQ